MDLLRRCRNRRRIWLFRSPISRELLAKETNADNLPAAFLPGRYAPGRSGGEWVSCFLVGGIWPWGLFSCATTGVHFCLATTSRRIPIGTSFCWLSPSPPHLCAILRPNDRRFHRRPRLSSPNLSEDTASFVCCPPSTYTIALFFSLFVSIK